MTKLTATGGISRRQILTAFGIGTAAALTGCTSSRAVVSSFAPLGRLGGIPPEYAQAYGPMSDGGYDIPGINFDRVDRRFLRREVDYFGGEAPGTIIIDTPSYYAYLVQPGERAMRYGVGIGREGFGWGGRAVVQWKRAWPTWTPPREMIQRMPELAEYADGMEPGLANPLGARALYLFQNGEDTLYRLHGTPEYWTIGTASSSGCVRFMNQDIIDLYDRARNGATVIVNQGQAIV